MKINARLMAAYRPKTLAEVAELPPITWLIDQHLPEDGLTLIYGAPASYKSFIAFDWGMSIASGLPWLGATTSPRRVVYICAEGLRGVDKRTKAWMVEHNVTSIPDFFVVTCPVPIAQEEDQGSFVKIVQEVVAQPGLIILDTLARCFGGGDENSTHDMNQFVNAIDALRIAFPRCSILVVHHAGKEEQKGSRGSTALTGAADAVFRTERKTKGQVKFSNEKQKDSEEVEPRQLSVPEAHGSRVVRVSDPLDEPLPKELKIETDGGGLLDALRAAGRLSYTELFTSSGISKRKFDKALQWLKSEGLIEPCSQGGGYVPVNA